MSKSEAIILGREMGAGIGSDPFLVLDIPIEPCAASRPRFSRQGHAYHTPKYKQWIKDCKDWFAEIGPVMSEPFAGPVAVFADFILKRPKTTKLAAPKPDIDNFMKALFDSLTKAAVWLDDKQIVNTTARKRWAPVGVDGHVLVHLFPMEAL